jgi:hypothetical protein
MSYILDALKKSELERSRKAAPSLIGTAPHLPNARTKIAVAVTVALFTNALLIGAWWFWPRNASLAQDSTALAQTTTPESSVTEQPAVVEASPAPAAASQTERAATPPPARPASPPRTESLSPAPAPRVASAKPAAIAFNALSADQQRAFAGLEFSTHVYADEPDFRSVTINGHRFKEGDVLPGGFVLSEITEDGVVVDQSGKRVELSVLQDWRL